MRNFKQGYFDSVFLFSVIDHSSSDLMSTLMNT